MLIHLRYATIVTGLAFLLIIMWSLTACAGKPSHATLSVEQIPATTVTTIPGLHPYTPGPTASLNIPENSTLVPTASATIPVLLGKDLFDASCASCHGSPPRDALLAAGDSAAVTAITQGTGQMQAFGGTLSKTQINSLIDFLSHAPVRAPVGPSYPHPAPSAPCTSCHNDTQLGAPDPSIHKGVTDAMCSSCHFPALQQPPPILHSQSSQLVCSDCHAKGGTAHFLDSHTKPGYESCGFCHTQWNAPPQPPHDTDGTWANCPQCHFSGSANPVPPSHNETGWQDCAACHVY